MADATSSSVEITGTRKIIVLSLAGLVCVLAVVAAAVPDAREYVVKIVQSILTAIPTLAK